MNKKILAIALIVFFIAAAVAFADVAVTYTANSVTVTNTARNSVISEVQVCVIYTDAAGERRETSLRFTDVRTSKRENFNLGTVIGAYSTFCAVPEKL